MLMMVSVIVEFNMWLDCFTAMNILLMVMVLDRVNNFTLNNFMMMVWGCMVYIIMNLMDMSGLMMVYVMMIIHVVVYNFVVYWLNMVDMHIMMIKIVKAMVRVDIVMEMSMACISKVVKLI